MEVLITLQKNVSKGLDWKTKKSSAAGASDNRRTERTSRKCFSCISEDHIIAKCPKPPKDNEKRQKKLRFNETGNRARNNSKNNSDQKIYVSMEHMSNNDKFPSGNFGDIW